MHEFDDIRPYRDAEVPRVVERLLRDPKLQDAAGRLFTPGLFERWPKLARACARLVLRAKAPRICSIADFQLFLATYFGRLIDETISELSVSGLDELDSGQAYLYISNHRDILMDTGLVNFGVHGAGHDTPEAAVGDNLLTEPLVADLMRLNKSFVIERSVSGKKAV